MNHFPKETEYAILAIKYLSACKDLSPRNAEDISTELNVPSKMIHRTMRKLAKKNLVVSYQGKFGGYTLKQSPTTIYLQDILGAFEEDNCLIKCASETANTCDQFGRCSIRKPMLKAQRAIMNYYFSKPLSELYQ